MIGYIRIYETVCDFMSSTYTYADRKGVSLPYKTLTDEYSVPSPSMQRKRSVATPLMTTQPESTGRISSRPESNVHKNEQLSLLSVI